MADHRYQAPCHSALPSEDAWIQHGRLLHDAGSVANADVYLVDRDGTPAVLKTFRRRPWLVRLLFSRWTLAHEVAVMQALEGVPGIPRLYGRVGRDSVLMEYVDGAGPVLNSREVPADQRPTREFFVRLRELVATMHARGVSHGDMRRRNIMQGQAGTPYLIDFATAIVTDGPGRFLRRRLVAWFAVADDYAVAKLIGSYYPDLLTADEERRLREIPWHLRLGRFLRKHVYRRFIKQKHWQERWDNWRHGRLRQRRRRRRRRV